LRSRKGVIAVPRDLVNEQEGLETIQALKGLDPAVKIIAMSVAEKVGWAIFRRLWRSGLAGSSTSHFRETNSSRLLPTSSRDTPFPRT